MVWKFRPADAGRGSPSPGDVETGDSGDALLGVDPGAVAGEADEVLAIRGRDPGVVPTGVDGGEASAEQQARSESGLRSDGNVPSFAGGGEGEGLE